MLMKSFSLVQNKSISKIYWKDTRCWVITRSWRLSCHISWRSYWSELSEQINQAHSYCNFKLNHWGLRCTSRPPTTQVWSSNPQTFGQGRVRKSPKLHLQIFQCYRYASISTRTFTTRCHLWCKHVCQYFTLTKVLPWNCNWTHSTVPKVTLEEGLILIPSGYLLVGLYCDTDFSVFCT